MTVPMSDARDLDLVRAREFTVVSMAEARVDADEMATLLRLIADWITENRDYSVLSIMLDNRFTYPNAPTNEERFHNMMHRSTYTVVGTVFYETTGIEEETTTDVAP